MVSVISSSLVGCWVFVSNYSHNLHTHLMGVQQELLKKLGDSLVLKFRANIAPMKASGRTMASIHAVATDNTVEVLAARHIGTAEYGRKPTGSGASKGNPTLYEQIADWAKTKGIITSLNDSKSRSIVYLITRKIHREGWKTRLNKPLSSVTDSIDLDLLMREIVAYQASVYESNVIKELKAL